MTSEERDAIRRYIDASVQAGIRRGLEGVPPARGEAGADGRDGDRGDPGERGADGIPGRDGSDGRDGQDGAAGPPGDKGERGEAGPPGAMGETGPAGNAGDPGQAGAPGLAGRDGRDGKDGRDGISREEFDRAVREARQAGMSEVLEAVRFDGRTITLGERSWKLPGIEYRGVFSDGVTYESGDAVTWGGSLWICRRPTNEKPGQKNPDLWSLAAKKGSDGRDRV